MTRDVRPCTCGGTIGVPVHVLPHVIEQTMRRHQATPDHQRWRAAGGIGQPPQSRVGARGWVYEHGYMVPVG